MEQLLAEIRIAMDNKLYFIALQEALTIPDICGAMQSDNGFATGDKYCRWYNRYAKHRISKYVLAEDIYLFRCALLHQGSTIPSPRRGQEATYSRIMFAAPYSNMVWNCRWVHVQNASHFTQIAEAKELELDLAEKLDYIRSFQSSQAGTIVGKKVPCSSNKNGKIELNVRDDIHTQYSCQHTELLSRNYSTLYEDADFRELYFGFMEQLQQD